MDSSLPQNTNSEHTLPRQEAVLVESFQELERRLSVNPENQQIIINRSNIDIWIEYRTARLLEIKRGLKMLAYYLFFYLLVLLALFLQLLTATLEPLYFVLLFLPFYLSLLILDLKIWKSNPSSRLFKFKIVLQSAFYIAFHCLLFVYSFNLYTFEGREGPIPIWTLSLPLIASLLVFIFLTKWPQNSCTSTLYLLKLGGIILRCCVLVTLFIKMSSKSDIDMISLFWAYWCSLSIQIVVVFFCFMLSITVIFKLCLRTINCESAFGSFWSFCISFGFLLTSLIAVLQIIDYSKISTQQAKNEVFMSSVVSALVPLLVYFFVIVVMTIFSINNLTFWFEKMLFVDDILIQDLNDQDISLCDRDLRIRSMKFQKPWLLKRLTSTYFRKSKQDYLIFQEKMKNLRCAYKSKTNRMSVNLEEIMYKKKGFDVDFTTDAGLFEEESKEDNEFQASVDDICPQDDKWAASRVKRQLKRHKVVSSECEIRTTKRG